MVNSNREIHKQMKIKRKTFSTDGRNEKQIKVRNEPRFYTK